LKDIENLEQNERGAWENEGVARGSGRVRTKEKCGGVVKRKKTMRIGNGERYILIHSLLNDCNIDPLPIYTGGPHMGSTRLFNG
jgi:hypothetical protein